MKLEEKHQDLQGAIERPLPARTGYSKLCTTDVNRMVTRPKLGMGECCGLIFLLLKLNLPVIGVIPKEKKPNRLHCGE